MCYNGGMARTKAFTEEAIIAQAVVFFQQHGYENSSIRDLVEYVGLSSSSLYSTFGDKDAIFMLALEQCSRDEKEMIGRWLTASAHPKRTIRELFNDLAEQLSNGELPAGSLTFKAAVELSHHKPKVAAFLTRYADEVIQLLADFLEEATKKGQLSLRFPIADVARYLLFALFNLNYIVMVYPDREQLDGYIEIALSILEG